MPKIECLWAWISYDKDTNDEGVVGRLDMVTGIALPMIGADLLRIESLRQIAYDTAQKSGKAVKLVQFGGTPKVLETINPLPEKARQAYLKLNNITLMEDLR